MRLTPERLLRLKHRAVVSGTPILVSGQRDGCEDCLAEVDLVIHPSGFVDVKVFHDPICPWIKQRAAGL